MTMSKENKKENERFLCSVVIRTKDRPRHLFRALESIEKQERKPDEVIVVNDGGDSVDKVLETFQGLSIKSIVHDTSLGRAEAGNAGVAASNGHAVCFLDDDDRFFPDHLKRLELSMLTFDAKVAYSGSRIVQKDLLGEKEPEQSKFVGEFNDPYDPDRLKFENYIPLNTLLIDRLLFLEVGGFDSSFNLFEDWDMLIRLSGKTRFYHLNRITSEYAVWGKSHQITLASNNEQWRDAYSMVFNKYFIPLSSHRKVKLMADYWMVSQERRSRLNEMNGVLESFKQQNQSLAAQLQHHQILQQTQLDEQQASYQSQLDEQQASYQEQLNKQEALHHTQLSELQEVADKQNDAYRRKINALQSALMRKNKKSKELYKIIEEQNKQLILGLGSNDIRALLNAGAGETWQLSSHFLENNYQRLVDWIKSNEVKLNEDILSFFNVWQTIEERLASLLDKTEFLLQQLHGSRLRKIWRGIPIPQVESLIKKNQEILDLIFSVSVDSIVVDTGLMLPKEKKPLEQFLIQKITGYTPVFEAFTGNEDSLDLMVKIDGTGEVAVPIKPATRFCFTIFSTRNGFSFLKILLATYVRINTCDIRFFIYEEVSMDNNPDPLRIIEFNAIEILDNQYYLLSFDPIPDSKGKLYHIEIDSPNATSDQHIAVWCYPSNRQLDSSVKEQQRISLSSQDTQAMIYPWVRRLLDDLPIANLLNTDNRFADHTFWIYNSPRVNISANLPLFLLQLSEISFKHNISMDIVIYGETDLPVQTYCEKNCIKYRVIDQPVIKKTNLIPWVFQQLIKKDIQGFIWLFQADLRPAGDMVQNAEKLFKERPETGLIIPLVENSEHKISHAFSQITRDGHIHNFPVGMAVDHPINRYVRSVDAAEAPFFVMHSKIFKDISFDFLSAYHSLCYQMTEMIWRLSQMGIASVFDPGICFYGDRFEDIVSDEDLEKDRLKFIKNWKSKILYKPSVYNDLPILLNPDNRRTALIIDMTLPTFDEDSGSLRMYELLKLFVKMGIKTTFFPDNLDCTLKYKRALEFIGVEVFSGDYTIADALARRQYDMVILSRVDIGHRYMNLIKLLNPNARIYYDTVDIHYVREFRQAEIEENETLYNTAVKTRQKELANCILADVVFTVTEDDKQHLLKEIPSLDCFVLPNIHTQLTFDISWDNTEGLVFIGNYNHPPNEDAVFYFVENVFPLIQARIQGIKLYLIGSYMRDSMKALASESIRVLGWVENVEPELVKHRVFVSYLRYGAGMKGKIGQAMALGLPVVSTSIGSEGMGLKDCETVMVADDPEIFADKVCRVYKDKELWEGISGKGKNYIYRQYGTEAVKEKLKGFLDMDLNQNFPIMVK